MAGGRGGVHEALGGGLLLPHPGQELKTKLGAMRQDQQGCLWSPLLSGFTIFFFFNFMAAPLAYGSFPGQGWNLSHICNLDHSCGNTRSFNPQLCSDPSGCCWILNPLHHDGTAWVHYFKNLLSEIKKKKKAQ